MLRQKFAWTCRPAAVVRAQMVGIFGLMCNGESSEGWPRVRQCRDVSHVPIKERDETFEAAAATDAFKIDADVESLEPLEGAECEQDLVLSRFFERRHREGSDVGTALYDGSEDLALVRIGALFRDESY